MSASVSFDPTVYSRPLTGRMRSSLPGLIVSGLLTPLLDRTVSTSTPNVLAIELSVSPGCTSYVRVLGTARAAVAGSIGTPPPTDAACSCGSVVWATSPPEAAPDGWASTGVAPGTTRSVPGWTTLGSGPRSLALTMSATSTP